jgi:hypothetical protein
VASYDRLVRSVSSAGPFTATVVAASNLSVGAGVTVIFAVWARLTASARFRVRAPGPVSVRLLRDDQPENWSSSRGFPLPFGHRHSLLGHPVPAEELSPPHGRPTGLF